MSGKVHDDVPTGVQYPLPPSVNTNSVLPSALGNLKNATTSSCYSGREISRKRGPKAKRTSQTQTSGPVSGQCSERQSSIDSNISPLTLI